MKSGNRELLKWGLIAFGLWLIVFFFIFFGFKGNYQVTGTFGDTFGAVNALVSALAFAGIIVTIRQQHEDLKCQHEALKQSIQEMQSQTEEFDMQNHTLKKQQFENTFFELLRMLQTIVNDLTLTVGFSKDEMPLSQRHSLIFHGRAVFQELFTTRWNKQIEGSRYYIFSLNREIKTSSIDKTLSRNDMMFLYHYLRFVYRIIKFVDETPILKTTEDKYKYIAFLRSTFSNYEVALLFYNCLSSIGREKFKPLAERYALFDNLDNKLLANPKDRNQFQSSAFTFAYTIRLECVCSTFKMRVVTEGEYQWQINLNLKALYGDVGIDSITLKNKDSFVGNVNDERDHLPLQRYLPLTQKFDIEEYPKTSFDTQVRTLFQEHAKDVSTIQISNGKSLQCTFLDTTYTIRQCDCYDPMPSKGWSLEITYLGNRHLSIPLELSVLGELDDNYNR